MREMGPAMTRGMTPVNLMHAVDELLNDSGVLSEMAVRGGAPAGTTDLM